MTRSPAAPPRRRLLRSPVAPRRAAVEAAASRNVFDSDRALQSLALENALLARELGRVQRRCTQWRDDGLAQVERLEAALMRARAGSIAKETHIAALRDALDALQKRAAVWLRNEELVRRLGDLRARNRTLEAELAQSGRPVAATRLPADAAAQAANDEPACRCPETPPACLPESRRVLCVGGRARQIPVYRALAERHGAVLEHVDGSSDDDRSRLESLLARADAVILQAGYACQGACRAVERHCAEHGKPCVWLDKPCAPGFERSLAQVVGAVPHPTGDR